MLPASLKLALAAKWTERSTIGATVFAVSMLYSAFSGLAELPGYPT
jgi:hypothetical protein